jgi:hypothetical protein
MLSGEKAEVSKAEERLHDEDGRHGQGIGESAAIGALEKGIDQHGVREVVKHKRAEQYEAPVPEGKRGEDARA